DGILDLASTNISCSGCSPASNGTLVDIGGGVFTYTPYQDFNGSDAFTYEICDDRGVCDTATVSITVNPVSDPPVANDDSETAAPETPLTFDVAANDQDPDGDLDPGTTNTACPSCSTPATGTLINNLDGTFTYTSGPNPTGEGFVYEICDGDGNCDTATVTLVFGSVTIEVQVNSSSDDAEENVKGRVSLTSSDLEMVFDRSDQIVGARFNAIDVPQGANIASAYIQFMSEDVSSEPTTLTIAGQAHDNAPTFDNIDGNISARLTTSATVSWAPDPWTQKGLVDPEQQTPDLTAIIQEIVDRPGWSTGNSLVVIIWGSGKRVAESYNGNQAGAPMLHIEYH
ncbi:MAG: cadherin-like domain-containing protein, partial [Saprospiraceae bacterium]|nr:cadherin-like domain-containing protein [Saprospiraceae bacterium]